MDQSQELTNQAGVGADSLAENSRKEALGKDPTLTDKIKVPIDEYMEKLWSNWTNKGIETNYLEFLIEQYELPGFLIVPEINPEIIEILGPNAVQRDEYLKQTQQITANSIISSGSNLVVLMDKDTQISEDLRLQLINLSSEPLQLQCQIFYEQTQSRRAIILKSIKDTSLKTVLEKQQVDKFLFGEDLPAKAKNLKNIKNVAKDLTASSTSKKSSRASDFLYQRSLHPHRRNLPWSGQGSQQNRWPTANKSQTPFYNQITQSKRNFKYPGGKRRNSNNN